MPWLFFDIPPVSANSCSRTKQTAKAKTETTATAPTTAAEKGKDKKHLTLPQAAAMLGLSSEDFLIEDEDTDSDLKLSAQGDIVSAQEKKYQEKVVTVQFSTKNHSQKVDFLKNGKAIPVKKRQYPFAERNWENCYSTSN